MDINDKISWFQIIFQVLSKWSIKFRIQGIYYISKWVKRLQEDTKKTDGSLFVAKSKIGLKFQKNDFFKHINLPSNSPLKWYNHLAGKAQTFKFIYL